MVARHIQYSYVHMYACMYVNQYIYIYVSLSLQWNDRFVKRKPLRPQQVNESTQPQRADEKLRRNEVPDIHELSKFGIGLGEVEDTLRWLGTVDAWHNGSPKIIGCYCMLLCVAIYCYVYNIYIYLYLCVLYIYVCVTQCYSLLLFMLHVIYYNRVYVGFYMSMFFSEDKITIPKLDFVHWQLA